MIRNIIVIASFIFAVNQLLAGNDWKLALDKDGIKVYTRTTALSQFKEFRGEITIDGSLSDISNSIFDVEKYPEWCYKTTSATVFYRDSATVQYFYISETPFFLSTRVACFELNRRNDTQQGKIIFYLENTNCKKPISKNMLLIPVTKGYWELSEVSDGKVKVTMQMLTEPGGIIPAWLANLVVVESPYITLRNLSERVKNKKIENR